MKTSILLVLGLGLAACTATPRQDPVVAQALADAHRIAGNRIGGISSSQWTPAMKQAGYDAQPRIVGFPTYAEVRELYRGSAFSPPDSCPYSEVDLERARRHDVNAPTMQTLCSKWESDRTTADNKRLTYQWQQAEQAHVCNSYNPMGCLSDAQKAGARAQTQQNISAVECYYGNGSACTKYPGGTAAATGKAQEMLWESCINTYRDIQSNYYGTEHLPCKVLP